MVRKMTTLLLATLVGMTAALFAATPASAAKSQCLARYQFCAWTNTGYGGSMYAWGNEQRGCLGTGNYGIRSIWNRENPGATLYVFSGRGCTGTTKRYEPGTAKSDIGFTALTYEFVEW
jgi:hypothetical protein